MNTVITLLVDRVPFRGTVGGGIGWVGGARAGVRFRIYRGGGNNVPIVIITTNSSAEVKRGGVLVSILNVPILIHALGTFRRYSQVDGVVLITGDSRLVACGRLYRGCVLSGIDSVIRNNGGHRRSILYNVKQLGDDSGGILVRSNTHPFMDSRVVYHIVSKLGTCSTIIPTMEIGSAVGRMSRGNRMVGAIGQSSLIRIRAPRNIYGRRCLRLLGHDGLDLFASSISFFRTSYRGILAIVNSCGGVGVAAGRSVVVTRTFLGKSVYR